MDSLSRKKWQVECVSPLESGGEGGLEVGRFRRIVKSKHSVAETVCCCRGKRDEIWGDGEEYNLFGGASEENNLWE